MKGLMGAKTLVVYNSKKKQFTDIQMDQMSKIIILNTFSNLHASIIVVYTFPISSATCKTAFFAM